MKPTLDMCAVAAQPGRVTLHRDKHLVSSSVVRRRVGAHPVEVPGKALNYVVEKVRPSLLVIDAEGAERELFDGAWLPTVSTIVRRAVCEAMVASRRAASRVRPA